MRSVLLLAALLLSFGARAAELHIVSSGGFAAAYKVLAPIYEKKSGDTLIIGWGPSMGETHDAVPARMQRGEPIDVLIMVGSALGQLIDQGKVIAGSRVDLARSGIGVAVKAGAPHPDISSVEGLKQALLAAPSIAYSDSASGVYISSEMFKAMGIAAQVAGKAHMIPATPVGEIVAKGEAALGFQQISELKPVVGIDLLGPLPHALQKYTVFSGGVVAGSAHPDAAKALLAFLGSGEAKAAIVNSGMEPVTGK